MQEGLDKLIVSNNNEEMLLNAAISLAESKFSCINYSDLYDQTKRIEKALEISTGLPDFLEKAVRHIYVTPDKVRMKFINGKTVKSERSNNNE